MRPARDPREIMPALVVGGVLSGVPSTIHAIVTGRSVLAATVAAGVIAGRPGLGRGLLVHVLVTTWWTAVLAATLPRRRTAVWGAMAGLAIGVLDLAIADRHYPAIANLPRGAQLADHVAFGTLVASTLRVVADVRTERHRGLDLGRSPLTAPRRARRR